MGPVAKRTLQWVGVVLAIVALNWVHDAPSECDLHIETGAKVRVVVEEREGLHVLTLMLTEEAKR